MSIIQVNKCAAQGDVLFIRVDSIPPSAKAAERTGPIIVAHSESGHNHAIESPCATMFVEPSDSMTCYLQVADGGLAEVVHHRPFDTHQTLGLSAGLWMVRRQREHTPAGFRRVED